MSAPTPLRPQLIPADRGGVVVIDIDAVRENYRRYRALAGPVPVGASLKANAYGLDVERIGPALAAEGCEIFFVALPCEAIALRKLLPQACIVVLCGPDAESAPLFVRHRLSPALNSLEQIAEWQKVCAAGAAAEAAALHIDTGMARLGLSPEEVERLTVEPSRLDGVALQCVLSHLACADDPEHSMNARQRDAFIAAAAALEPTTGRVPRSLANSSGAFLGADFHFDLIRPGAGLYGINPMPSHANPMLQTVSIYARIVQIRNVAPPQTVGYGAAHRVTQPSRIATVAIGYGDGYMRAVGNIASGAGIDACSSRNKAVAHAYIGETVVPVVGRVSMDLITLDVSGVPDEAVYPGAIVELMGDRIPVDEVARWAGTIGYEVLTGIGDRLHRIYSGGDC